MQHVNIEDIEVPPTNSPADIVRPISEALKTTELAINYFELVPGESFGYAYHRHHDQEEMFHILTGTATFETESGDIEVNANELIRFSPGEFNLERIRQKTESQHLHLEHLGTRRKSNIS